MQGAHDGARAPRFGDARDAARPAIANAGDRRLGERRHAGRLLQRANAPDPVEKLRLVVFRAAAQMRELEMRVAVDEPGHQLRVGELHGACGVRRGHVGIPTHSRDSSGFVNENGAVLEGRRRYGMNPASSDTKQDLGCDPDTKR